MVDETSRIVGRTNLTAVCVIYWQRLGLEAYWSLHMTEYPALIGHWGMRQGPPPFLSAWVSPILLHPTSRLHLWKSFSGALFVAWCSNHNASVFRLSCFSWENSRLSVGIASYWTQSSLRILLRTEFLFRNENLISGIRRWVLSYRLFSEKLELKKKKKKKKNLQKYCLLFFFSIQSVSGKINANPFGIPLGRFWFWGLPENRLTAQRLTSAPHFQPLVPHTNSNYIILKRAVFFGWHCSDWKHFRKFWGVHCETPKCLSLHILHLNAVTALFHSLWCRRSISERNEKNTFLWTKLSFIHIMGAGDDAISDTNWVLSPWQPKTLWRLPVGLRWCEIVWHSTKQ